MEKLDEGLKTLLDLGKRRGFLTFDQVNDYLPDEASSPEKIHGLLESLDELGIELINEDEAESRLLASGEIDDEPDELTPTMSKLRNVSKKLLQEKGREPTIEETARAANISIEETRRVLKMSRHPISLDRPVGESEDSYFSDFIEDDRVESPVNAATQEMLKDKIAQ